MSCLLIFIDACREDYISHERMPFLNHLKSISSYSRLSFTPSFDSWYQLMTGKSPDSLDMLFDFCLDPVNSPFRFLRLLHLPLNLRRGSSGRERILNRIVNRIYHIFTGHKLKYPPNIPPSLLPYFSVNPSSIRMSDAEQKRTEEHLLGILNKHGFTFDYAWGMGPDKIGALHKYPEGDHVWLLCYGELDELGHSYGPDSVQVNAALKTIDNNVERIYNTLINGIDFLMIFSDHDMERVDVDLDLWSELRKLRVRMPKDYLVFLNSPVARFWFNNERARSEVGELLSRLNRYGRKIAPEEFKSRGLPCTPRYGECIFWLRKGVNITPDFYHGDRLNGMHTYFDSPAVVPFILYRRKGAIQLKPEGNLRDMMPTLLDLLGIQIDLNGNSLITGK